ncbi:MAG: ABC transporter permease, partial [Bacteroidetes bacterium]|nr:ABC transporter permease [Bacteroidota bacterium]
IISYETSFDNYHANSANIYRLINEFNVPNKGIVYEEGQVHPLGQAIRNDFPGVDAVMTYYAEKGQITIVKNNGSSEKFQENTGLVYAEPNIFKIFDFEFIAGDPSSAISNMGSAVIASSLAQKYFNLSANEVYKAINNTFIIDNKTTFRVSGIISDPPRNSDLPFKIIANYRDQTTSNPYFRNGTDWYEGSSAINCYLLLSDGISVSNVEKQLVPFDVKYFGEESTHDQKYVLQPLSELHSGMCENYNNRQVSTRKLKFLSLIGLFIMIIASINFINLSAVQATKRFKEISVRKILGVKKYQLISQALSETVFISFIASIAGLFIAQFMFVHLENIIGYQLNLELLKNTNTLFFLTAIVLGVGLLSGLYPALMLAGFKPSGTLKNAFSLKNSSGSLTARRVLVIIQFTISLVLIIGTLVMHKQMNYFSNKDLGFNKDAILISTLPDANTNKLQLLKSNLLNYPGIEKVSYGTRSPLADWKVNNAINYPTLEQNMYYGNLKTADEDYLELFQLKFIAGENYSAKKDNGNAVVNRKLTELLGFMDPHEALGERIKYGRGNFEFAIVGVVEDFHAQSLHQNMENVIFSNFSRNNKEMAVKINPATASLSGLKEAVERIQSEWQKTFPDVIFNYSFLDEQIASLYNEEQRTTRLVQLFAIIAIIIGCLGLFGLISYVTSVKIKEIGIRKVNGAKVSEILTLLNKDFIKWVATAFVIACPIAYYAMNKWLENFAYKTELSWWIFALAGLLALGIALLTVSWQSWRAATRNPVEALRYE